MRYEPPDTYNDDETTSYEKQIIREPISDQTAYMRWSTELEKIHHIIDNDFLQNNKHRIIDINKILPLSFIENPRAIKLFHLRRMNIELAKDAGLYDLADTTVMDNLADYQTTRGTHGNYQKALITTRREWEDKTKSQEKKGIFGRLMRKQDYETEMQQLEMY